MLRYSASGDLLWGEQIESRYASAVASGLEAHPSGVLATISDHACCEVFDHDGYVQAIRPDGSEAWRNDFEAPGIPESTWDAVSDITIGAGGRIFVAGAIARKRWRGQPATLPDEDRMIQALSPRGRVLWTRVVGRPGAWNDDWVSEIDARGKLVVVSGSSWSRWSRSSGVSRAWLGAFDRAGRRLWVDAWGWRKWSREASAVAVSPWGPIYVGTDFWLRRYSRGGQLVWERGVPGAGWISGVAAAGSVYLTTDRSLQRWRR